MSADLRFLGCHIDHPTGREREQGAVSYAYLSLSTPANRTRVVPLTNLELIRLIEQASNHLYTILRTEGDAASGGNPRA